MVTVHGRKRALENECRDGPADLDAIAAVSTRACLGVVPFFGSNATHSTQKTGRGCESGSKRLQAAEELSRQQESIGGSR